MGSRHAPTVRRRADQRWYVVLGANSHVRISAAVFFESHAAGLPCPSVPFVSTHSHIRRAGCHFDLRPSTARLCSRIPLSSLSRRSPLFPSGLDRTIARVSDNPFSLALLTRLRLTFTKSDSEIKLRLTLAPHPFSRLYRASRLLCFAPHNKCSTFEV